MKVGEIESIALDPNFDARVTLRLSREIGELPADTGAAIFTSGLLGERYVGLSPGGDPEPLRDGDEILLTQPAVVLEQLIGKFLFNKATETPAGEAGASGSASAAGADDAF